jgi:hypothetical protein
MEEHERLGGQFSGGALGHPSCLISPLQNALNLTEQSRPGRDESNLPIASQEKLHTDLFLQV